MKQDPHWPSRRGVLRAGSLALAGLPFLTSNRAMAKTAEKPLFSAMGVAANLARAAFLKAAGAQFLTENTGNFLVPDKGDEVFAKNLEKLAASPLPVMACNGFIRPANLRCVGKEANHDEVLAWAESAFRRLALAKGKFIVFGSSGARALRDGWPKDKADVQFVALLKRMGPLAEKHGVTVAVEQLQASECNYINHIGEAAKLIREAGHPHVRVLADLYHMMKGGDTPADLKAAMDVVVHIEIAEKEGRTVPGVNGDDFRPFFRVLREANYRGAINIEGKGTDAQMAPAFATIAKQSAEV
ncbi:MAG: sugar phosphate isomerase/epimerase [Akkermansiaceae bacterium]|nr:sugar phosphate isomerase/epimerase [Akkermansiaceae bacterium]